MARAIELMPPDCPALVLPMMPFGKSDEHLAFPGTLTLSHETLGRVWYELGESVHSSARYWTLVVSPDTKTGQSQSVTVIIEPGE
jgi:creatinine amidohydrolase/Fe(II)-dependent formamide hydrolase-like protein